MHITLNKTGLTGSYQKLAEITFMVAVYKWVTIAAFYHTTYGRVAQYFMLKHGYDGKARRISERVYYNLVRTYASKKTRNLE